MALWHLMFSRPAYPKGQIKHIVYTLQDAQSFGGFALNNVGIVRETTELWYVDLDFVQPIGLTQGLFEEMVKYLVVLAGRLDHAPLPVYFAVMQRSLADLDITYHQYQDHSIDIMFWQGPPIVAPPEDQSHLRFRDDAEEE
ncbi:hypothetical protein [Lacticaseibacillus parakribbianus]|uniref:hypothetical protein n=1 Tax=Lacticaseibacillus parakribbianus TaxID=2970927 RepID=UPI0021CB216B|nr:hypothetical protein [Lacticaseibacillus parakribbianus]